MQFRIDPEIRNVFSDLLFSGEQVLWTGRPRTGWKFKKSDLPIVGFAIIWCGFLAFWYSMVYLMDAPVLFLLFGIPFVLVGIYLLLGRFYIDARRRNHTFYIITDQRIMIRTGIYTMEIESIHFKKMGEPKLVVESNLTGTIHLGKRPDNYYETTFPWDKIKDQLLPWRIEMIDDPMEVYNLIVSLQRNGEKPLM